MQYLVDTNILLRLVQRNDSLNPVIRNAVRKLKNDGNIMLITLQNCAEFWNVATRPATKNGFGKKLLLLGKVKLSQLSRN